jgi:hypothetical protein
LKNPRAGDLAVIHGRSDAEHPFVVLRVNKIEGDALDLSFSNFAYSTLDGARRALDDGVARDPSAETNDRSSKNEYFGEKHAAMARKTYAGLDVRYIERPGE